MKKALPEWAKQLIAYGICIAIGGLLVWLYFALRDTTDLTRQELYRMICDAFTIPGLVMMLIGALVWASTMGALDGIGFALGNLFRSLIPGGRIKKQKKFYDYVTERKEKRLTFIKYAFLFFTGAAFMIVALIFLALYYNCA